MSDPLLPDDDDVGTGTGTPNWALTYADLMNLLLTFFILLLAMASLDVRRFEQAAGSLRTTFSGSSSAATPTTGDAAKFAPPIEGIAITTQGDRTRALVREMRRRITPEAQAGGITVEESNRGVVVRVPGAGLFEAGSDAPGPNAEAALAEIAALLRLYPLELTIEGHTDDLAPPGSGITSNWQLSAARAVAALRHLVEQQGVDPRRLSAVGYADVRPRVPNDSAEHRAENRRIEFVFHAADEASPATATPDASSSLAP